MKIFFYYAPLIALAALLLFFASNVHASETQGTIVTGDDIGYAWSSVGGYVNFGLPTSTQISGAPNPSGYVQVTDTKLTGYAWDSNYGWLNLDPDQGGVTNDNEGNLGGYAWSAGGGWISFDGITINESGVFSGISPASATYGKLTFDCTHCDVRTDWRPRSVRSGASSEGGSSGNEPPSTPQPAPPEPTIPPPLPAAVGASTPDEGGATEVVEDEEGVRDGEFLPEELFDIRLVIDRRMIQDVRDLVARITFESFGRIPTPVELTFSIVDASGATLYTFQDDVVIETEGVLVTRFEDAPTLSEGAYFLRLKTLYNQDVEDNFEIPFQIVSEKESNILTYILWGIGILLCIAIILFILLKRRNKEEDEVRPARVHTIKSKNKQ